LACLLLATGGPLVTGNPARATSTQDPVRILLLGDSVTQGSVGDWTWRYRLWRHFTAAGVAVDFVGPENDLLDLAEGTYGHHDYLDPGFDQDHAARWGNALGLSALSVPDLVSTYQPDVVVELLGVNDFAALNASVDTVDQELEELVADARKQKADVSVVLGALGSDWIRNVTTFNAQLPGLAAQLDSPESRIVAAAPAHLVQDVDTYEFVHPAATGEVKIAAEIADALAALGIGPPATRPLPILPNGPRDPALLSVTPEDAGAKLSWSLPLGADRVYVEQRDLDAADSSWHRSDQPVLRPQVSTELTGLVDGDRYQLRLRAAKGTAIAEDIASRGAQVRPGVPAPVAALEASARRRGFRASWGSAALATSYRVTWWRPGHRGTARSARTMHRALAVHSLLPRHTYVVSVRGVHASFVGPSRQTRVVPTG
jgi:lysophospholipase L1-like esterase